MKFEEVLARSAEISNGVYVDAMLSMYDGRKHDFSAGFEEKIVRLKRRAEHPYIRRALRSAASIVLAILVTSAVWLTVDTQARAAFIGWVKGYYETLFVYQFTGTEEKLQTPKDYRLTWLPNGCSELMKTDTGGSISTVYVDAQGHYLKFHYIYQPDETVWYFDVSHTTRQDAEVYGYPADLFIANSAEHASALMWTDKDDTAFCISGYLTPEELFKLADSIEEIDREE